MHIHLCIFCIFVVCTTLGTGGVGVEVFGYHFTCLLGKRQGRPCCVHSVPGMLRRPHLLPTLGFTHLAFFIYLFKNNHPINQPTETEHHISPFYTVERRDALIQVMRPHDSMPGAANCSKPCSKILLRQSCSTTKRGCQLA